MHTMEYQKDENGAMYERHYVIIKRDVKCGYSKAECDAAHDGMPRYNMKHHHYEGHP